MEHDIIAFNSLLIIILLATFVPVLINKIKWLPIPIVVGEVLAGMIIGKSGFNLIQETPWLNFLYTFGFAFLLFLSGLEVDFDMMRSIRSNTSKSWGKNPILISCLLFLGTLVLGLIISFILKQMNLIVNIPLITLILSTTSLGIVVPTLKEKKLLNIEYGQVILLSALVADFATMVLVTVYVSFYTTAASDNVLLILLLFVFFFAFYRLGISVMKNNIIQELAHATSQIKVRGSFALILIFIALAQMLGTEIILGTFLAGLIVSLIDERERSQLYMKLDAIGYGFFVPIFFIMVGVNFDIGYVVNNPKSIYLLPLLLVSVYAVKIIPSLLLRVQYSWKESLAAGFLLSSRLSLIIATSAIGLKLNIISPETNGAIVLIAIITCTFSPIFFNKLSPGISIKEKNTVFIIGVKQNTLLVAKRLKDSHVDVTLITHSSEKYEQASQQNYKVLLGEPLDISFLKATDIKESKSVIISKNDEEIAEELCRICKEDLGIENVLLLNNKPTNISGRNYHGATVITPEFATVFMVENLIFHPNALSIFLEENESDVRIKEIYLKNSTLFDMPIRQLRLPGDALILSIVRNGEKIIPHGDNVLKEGDLIMLVGTLEHIDETVSLLSVKDQ